MPYRDRATVEGWIEEYRASYEGGPLVAVLDKNFEAGPNSGLVVVTLRATDTITYLHPEIRQGAPTWIVTFEPRSHALDLDEDGLRYLADDLLSLANLRRFLQEKTDAVVLTH